MHKLNQLSSMLFGIAYYLFNIITKGGYYGFQNIYRLAQQDDDCAGKRLVLGLLESPLGFLFENYHFMKRNKGRDRLTDNIIKEYDDLSVGGYGNLASDELELQQRGLIMTVLDETLKDVVNKTVIEIGTANGDVLAHYAEKYPDNRYIGIDFNVRKAQERWRELDNCWFYPGYALDMLESGDLHGDIVFSSSTFCLFAPNELAKYIAAMSDAGVKTIVLNEPCWSDYKQVNDGYIISRHITQSLWYHNYAGYLREGGYKVSRFDFFPYKPLTSTRPDIHVLVIRGDR